MRGPKPLKKYLLIPGFEGTTASGTFRTDELED